MRNYTNVNTG